MPLTGPDVLLYEKKDRIVTMTLNRPERLNALSVELWLKLAKAFEDFRNDEDAWVLILTGAGDRAFCTGFDLIDQAERNARGLGTPKLPLLHNLQIWKPMIAAINGFAVAGGWMLAQNCDVRLAAENAEMGIAEARWNMTAPWVCDLTRQIGLGHALEIVLWGDRRITAQRGYEIGWLNRVVPHDKLMDEAREWAERMLYLGPRAVRNFKETLYRGFYMTPEVGLAFGLTKGEVLEHMEDTVEGPRAFAEKRRPVFKNK